VVQWAWASCERKVVKVTTGGARSLAWCSSLLLLSHTSSTQDVMFPYAAKHVRGHLESTYASEETQEDIAAIRAQVRLT
jgi:hypothetical protein